VLVFYFKDARLGRVNLKDALPWTPANTAAFEVGVTGKKNKRTTPRQLASLKTAVEEANLEAALPRESRMAAMEVRKERERQ
jgi:hypothetical protein